MMTKVQHNCHSRRAISGGFFERGGTNEPQSFRLDTVENLVVLRETAESSDVCNTKL